MFVHRFLYYCTRKQYLSQLHHGFLYGAITADGKNNFSSLSLCSADKNWTCMHTRTHARTHAHARTHTHTHTRARAHAQRSTNMIRLFDRRWWGTVSLPQSNWGHGSLKQTPCLGVQVVPCGHTAALHGSCTINKQITSKEQDNAIRFLPVSELSVYDHLQCARYTENSNVTDY